MLIAHVTDPLNQPTVTWRAWDGTFIAFLEHYYPNREGLGASFVVVRRDGNERVPLVDFDFVGEPQEKVVLIDNVPQDPATITAIVVSISISIAFSLISFVLFAPPDPLEGTVSPTPSPVYSFRSRQNAARLGEPIAVAYGEVILTPDYASQPYRCYEDNEEYNYFLLACSYGDFIVDDVLIDTSSATGFEDGIILYEAWLPDAHGGVFGSIEAYSSIAGMLEDVQTSTEVSNQEMVYSPNTTEGALLSTTLVRAVFTALNEITITKYINGLNVNRWLTFTGSTVNTQDLQISGRTITENLIELTTVQNTIATESALSATFDTYTVTSLIAVGYDEEAGGDPTYRFTCSGVTNLVKSGEYYEFYIPSNGQSFVGKVTLAGGTPSSYSFHVATSASVPLPTFTLDVKGRVDYLTMKLWNGVPNPGEITSHILGWFVVGQADKTIRRIEFDFICPNGLYTNSSGTFVARTIPILVEYQRWDGDEVGSILTTTMTLSAYGSASLNTSQRMTEVLDDAGSPLAAGQWRVRIRRTDLEPTNPANDVSRLIWAGLKAVYVVSDPGYAVYEGMTMLAVRVQATKGISEQGQSRLRAKGGRIIRTLSDGIGLTMTGRSPNPVDVMRDIYTDVLIGANRSDAELDMTELAARWTQWDGENGFNGVFDTETTVMAAMNAVVTPVRAKVAPIGGQLSLVVSEASATRSRIFTPENMEAGSFKVFYTNRESRADGVRVEYKEPGDFSDATAQYPSAAVRPETMKLIGCTDATTALGIARWRWQEKAAQRKRVEFVTGLEALLMVEGERFGVAHPLPAWGDAAALVKDHGSRQLLLDRDVPASGYLWLRSDVAAGSEVGPFAFTRDSFATLTYADPGGDVTFTLYDMTSDREPTHVAFGSTTDFVTEWVLAKAEPQSGASVKVVGVVYDESVWAGT